jgi:hypothetical protein
MTSPWEQPSKRTRPRWKVASSIQESPEDWSTRLLAITVAIPAFELALYLGLVTVVLSPRLAAYLLIRLPLYFHALYAGMAVLVGVRYGMSGLTKLLGHLFGTHLEGEKDRKITLSLWAGLAIATLLAYLLSSPHGGA